MLSVDDPERQGFIQAIALGDPDDDMPTLVYADWLEAQGATRHAEWVRVQVRLARAEPQSLEWRGLRDRDQQLKKQNRDDPVEEPPELEGVLWGGYERGLIRSFQASDVPSYLNAAERIHHFAPIQQARFVTLPLADWRRLCESPWLANIRGLDLSQQLFTNVFLDRLRESPHTQALNWLDLRNNHCDDDGLRSLTSAPHLGRLKTLLLRGNQIGNVGVQALADRSYLVRLEHLDLSAQMGIGALGFAALAQAPHLPRLRRLNLSETNPHVAGLIALAEGTLVNQLEWVDLRMVRGTPKAWLLLEKVLGPRLIH